MKGLEGPEQQGSVWSPLRGKGQVLQSGSSDRPGFQQGWIESYLGLFWSIWNDQPRNMCLAHVETFWLACPVHPEWPLRALTELAKRGLPGGLSRRQRGPMGFLVFLNDHETAWRQVPANKVKGALKNK